MSLNKNTDNRYEILNTYVNGLTYKENVDDMRESPTLQMLESMERHLCGDLVKVYDPFITKDIVPNQYHDLDTCRRTIPSHHGMPSKWIDGSSMVCGT